MINYQIGNRIHIFNCNQRGSNQDQARISIDPDQTRDQATFGMHQRGSTPKSGSDTGVDPGGGGL